MTTVRVHATTQVGGFSRGPLSLTSRWSPVDVARSDVRAQLLESVGVHVTVHPLDVPKLADLGLALVGGRLVDRKAKGGASPPPATTSQPAAIAASSSAEPRGSKRAART